MLSDVLQPCSGVTTIFGVILQDLSLSPYLRDVVAFVTPITRRLGGLIYFVLFQKCFDYTNIMLQIFTWYLIVQKPGRDGCVLFCLYIIVNNNEK